MKKSEMVCIGCIRYGDGACRLGPQPLYFSESAYDPKTHWCAQGEWQDWSDKYQERIRYYWGEWDEDEHQKNGEET